MISGIYKITCIINSLFYIGSSINCENRLKDHKGGWSSNVFLQQDIEKYGIENFKFEIIEEIPLFEDQKELEDHLFQAEQEWLDKTQCWKREIGYNISRSARNPMFGRKHSIETRQKQSLRKMGKIPDEVARLKMRNAKLGLKHSEETKKKRSMALSGQNNPNFGKLMTNEQKEMISQTKQKQILNNKLQKNFKLSINDVRSIRHLSSNHTNAEIAKMFGLSRCHISQILSGKRWGKML